MAPWWPDAIGNYTFTTYVEDRNQPGTGADRFWLQVKNPLNMVVNAMSMPTTGAANAVTLGGGNIVAPH